MKQHSLATVLDGMRRAAIRQDGAGLSDGELFEAYLAERDQDFLEAVVRRHGPMVFSVCQRLLRNPHDAEDAFQATFLVLVRRAEAVWPRDQVGHWLYGVAYRTALEARRRAARRYARERPLEDFAAPITADESKEWREIKPLLDREVNGLPAKYRSVVVMCDLEGRTRKEAARHLGLPEGTVSGRLTTARRLLAKRLTRQGVTVSAPVLATLSSQAVASAEMPVALISTTLESAASISAAAPILALADAAMRGSVWASWKMPLLTLLCALSLGVIGWGALGGGPNNRTEHTTREHLLPKVELSPAAVTDRDRLQGTWVAVTGELDGVPNPPEMLRDLRLVFDGNRVTYWTHKGALPASFHLDPTKNPKEIDMEFVEGNTLRGIYEFDGQRLKFCWTKLGVRPKSFDTMAGDILTFLFVFEKKS